MSLLRGRGPNGARTWASRVSPQAARHLSVFAATGNVSMRAVAVRGERQCESRGRARGCCAGRGQDGCEAEMAAGNVPSPRKAGDRNVPSPVRRGRRADIPVRVCGGGERQYESRGRARAGACGAGYVSAVAGDRTDAKMAAGNVPSPQKAGDRNVPSPQKAGDRNVPSPQKAGDRNVPSPV